VRGEVEEEEKGGGEREKEKNEDNHQSVEAINYSTTKIQWKLLGLGYTLA
jgi:hypothetical protein